MKHVSIFAFPFFLSTVVNAQEQPTQDPLYSMKHFLDIGMSISATRINTNHTVFETDNGTYQFDKGKFLATYDASFNYGWLFKDPDDKSIMMLKTGINLCARNSNVKDSSGATLRFNESYVQLPIEVGFRSPLRYNTTRNSLFRAIEFYAGLYAATPIYEKLDDKHNIDATGNYEFGNTLRFGIMGELALSSLSNKGYGHRYGLKFSNDFLTLVKFKKTKYQLYPYYYTIGFFYNLGNKYR